MKQSVLRSLAVGAVCALGLTACGGSEPAPTAAGPTSTVDTGVASQVTPPDPAVVTAAEKEGEVLLYTNADEQLMKPVAAAFKAEYPRIELRSLALSDAQIFQRYVSEKATGARTADVVMTMDALGMLDFVAKGNVADYADENLPNLPEYAKLAPGVVAMSEDPVVAVFNTALLPKDRQPKDMAALAALSGSIKGKVGTTDIGNAVQVGAMNRYIAKHGESGWRNIERIGADAGVESGTGNLVQKILQGQYQASYFVAGTVRALITGDAAKVVNYTYLTDGTPLIPRAVAVTAAAGSPNAAKVFVNFLLSVKGQEAACKGGFTPYRAGVKCAFGLPAIEEAVGADNMIIGGYPADLPARQPEIVSRWNKAFQR